jgi:anti-sigma factor RsiW
MDARQLAERQIVERYLADQLTEEEAQAFEAYTEAHPEIVREIETIARMKSGLTVLRRRGELDALLGRSVPKWYRRPAILVTLAASVAAVAFLIAQTGRVDRGNAYLAATLQQLAEATGGESTVSSRILLSRLRGITPSALSVPPGASAVEVTLQVSAPPGSAHDVGLLRITDGSAGLMATLDDVTADTEGNIAIFVSANALVEGSYLFRVSTEGREPQDFGMRVVSQD